MRLAKALFCAAALFALAAQGVRADDYNKLTYMTFSAPVQVPGATLAAGTYMFKLANPESGRRSIQIWDQAGTKLHTTLLTMTDARMEIPKQPMVMFGEAPSGEAPAVRSWFYEGERIGYEFVYPKDQAMKIARAAHTSVLAMLEALNAKVARIDETGQFDDASASTTSQSATAAPVPSSTTATAGSAPQPTANRTEPTAPSARTDAATPVGTTGSATTSAPQSASAASTTSTQPAARAADTTPRQSAARELPRTASSLPLFGLLGGVSLLSALGVRRLRRRCAQTC